MTDPVNSVSPSSVERYWTKVFTAAGEDACWPWLGAISDTGHGKFQIGSRTNQTAVIVSAHRLAFALAYGPIQPGEQILHSCDEASCQNPRCLRSGNPVDNALDWSRRRHRIGGPLNDVRRAAGRAVAIRQAIRECRDTGGTVEQQCAAWATAARAGLARSGNQQLDLPLWVAAGKRNLWA